MKNTIEFFTGKEIDRKSPLPLYFQIKELINEFVHCQLDAETIPSENELVDIFNVSRATIRQAITELAADGLLSKKKGKGTFINRARLEQPAFLESIYNTVQTQGSTIRTEVIESIVKKVDEKITKILKCNENSDIFRLRRLRFVNDQPNHIVVNYIPVDRCPGIQKIDFKEQSLTRILKENYKLQYKSQESIIQANISGKYESTLLEIPVGSPIQHVETVNFDSLNIPVDYYVVHYRGDQHQIKYKTTL